ncbi:septation protein SepH [Kutzneria viridogrisea]|uniref:DUF3071 domain-containing protein n=2 Tax=Kutzneria TaxID=43356 RepID=W5VYI0_9PSEU|nr:septation protein SepH [Kutzneria albida]AHH93973.1 hypothetical protein KALB_597 [Kutzneria albida DSM 43870]MBA8931022.1 hypothetical protein [Kutzneria viridogrisea]
MRALRVVGLDDDGTSVICEDPVRGERYTIPCDERLRAAARGDAARLGQIAAETETQMRPREIQARIRAGESVEQVATAAGLPVHRVERFAYPVLLERSRTAELAQRAHPIREDGPDVQTLGEIIAHSFGLRGQDYSCGEWDSWRGEDGKWIIQLHWQAGRSDNRAHWAFHPGAHGGTVTAIDDHAIDLLDPSPSRPLRTVRPVTELARQALELEHTDLGQHPADHAVPAAEPQVAEPSPEPPAAKQEQPPAPEITDPEPEQPPAPAAQAPQPEQHSRKAEAPPRRGKKNHPIVPSWEDVLLGVRSQR